MELNEILRKTGFKEGSNVELLAGDASTRKYYRIKENDTSYVIMQSEPFSDKDPNIICHDLFRNCGTRVPEFIKVIPQEGIIVEEDIGGVHLQDVSDKGLLENYYNKAVDDMHKYQKTSTNTAFTKEKFLSELDMTFNYYVTKYRNKKLDNKKKVDSFCVDLVDKMMDQDKLFLHRDYHSRNIMVKDGELVVIDFQDARMGPYTYDVVSLAIDPYISLDETFRTNILKLYYDLVSKDIGVDYDDYLRHCDLCYLQRGIKMLGTFSYQKIEKNKDGYLKYIPSVLDSIKRASKRFPEWQALIDEVYIR